MRESEARRVADHAVALDDIDVQRARMPMRMVGGTSLGDLDGLRTIQLLQWRPVPLADHRPVHELWSALLAAHRWISVGRRDFCHDETALLQCRQRPCEGRLNIT